MKISSAEFLAKYQQLFLSGTPGLGAFAYWKMRWLIENGECFYLPEHDCFYVIRDKHLLVYHSPDGQMHLSEQALNQLDCITLPAALYDAVKDSLTGFEASYGWRLRYDFGYQPSQADESAYEAVDFDFTTPEHYVRAAEIIGGEGGWFMADNVRKMTTYPTFDPGLWFFVKDKATQALSAVSISTYEPQVRQTDLDWIFVAPQYHAKGCGRFLIEETIRRCRDKSDDICVAGEEAFYRKCGFVDHGLWVWAPKDGYQFHAPGMQP